MFATFLYTLRRYRGQFLGWSLGLSALVLIIVSSYQLVLDNQQELTSLVDSLPSELKAFTGEAREFITPSGYLHARFFTILPLVFGIFAIMIGSGLFAGDEESGRLDLLMAYPISRTHVFLGRLAAVLLVTIGILFDVWVVMAIAFPYSAMTLSGLDVVPAFLSLLAVSLVFTGLALVLSMILPSRSATGLIGGLVLFSSFMLTGLAKINPSLEFIADMLPIAYYQGGEAIREFHVLKVIGLLGAALALFALAYWRFLRRDIRVAGEGTLDWRIVLAVGAACVVLTAVVVKLTWTTETYDSPQEVYQAAQTATKEKDWQKLTDCLTPEALEQWTGELVGRGALLQENIPKSAALADKNTLSPELLQNAKYLLPVFLDMGKAMAHVDANGLKKFQPTIQRIMQGKEPSPQEVKSMANLVKDRHKFTATMLKALAHRHEIHIGNGLKNVEIDEDSATATLVIFADYKKIITFRKIAGSWKIALPFPEMIDLPLPGSSTEAREESFAGYVVHYNRVYAKRGKDKLRLDVYIPKKVGPFPGVLVIHGGGWNSGNKDQLAGYAKALAKRGYVAFAINYRLAPRYKHPAQLEDCRSALLWIRQHAEKYNVDAHRIGAVGYSAGGHLAALLGTTGDITLQIKNSASKVEEIRLREVGYAGSAQLATCLLSVRRVEHGQLVDTRLQAVVSGGAPCEFRTINEDSQLLKSWLGGTRKQRPEQYESASPTAFAGPDSPPTCFFHGQDDLFVPLPEHVGKTSPRRLAKKLAEMRVKTKLIIISETGHFGAMFHRAALEQAWKFLDEHLRAK